MTKDWGSVTARIKQDKIEKLSCNIRKHGCNKELTPNQFSKRLFELLADDEKLCALLVKKVGLSQ